MRAHRRQILLSSLALLGLVFPLHAGTDGLTKELEAHVRGAVAASGFSGAILVARGDEVLLRTALGMADHEAGTPNTPETRFRLASISKQFTSASVLRLVDADLLGLETLAGEFWEETPPSWSEVTVEHLMRHTSGIHNFTNMPIYSSVQNDPLRPEDVLSLVVERPLDFKVGSDWRYSNTGYVMLALIAERAGEARFEDVLVREVLKPLGMQASGSESAYDEVPGLARGYSRAAPDWEPAGSIDMNVPTGGGGMFSTVDDMRVWAHAVSTRHELLRPETWEAMLTPGRNSYGLGVIVEDLDGIQRVSHSGGIEGFSTWLGIYPASDATIVVLANTEEAASGRIGAELEALLLGREAAR